MAEKSKQVVDLILIRYLCCFTVKKENNENKNEIKIIFMNALDCVVFVVPGNNCADDDTCRISRKCWCSFQSTVQHLGCRGASKQ